MTVKDLKKMLKDFPEDLIVVKSGRDHSYYQIDTCYKEKAEQNPCQELYEYYGKEHMSKSRNKVVKVLVLA